jgi:hypothetical protein
MERAMARFCIGAAALAVSVIGSGLAVLSFVGVAEAAPQPTAWSTYLRSGPGDTFPVIDELEHGTLLNVGACSGRWCRVVDGSTIGYIDKDALFLPKPPPAAATVRGAQGCFVADQTGYKHPTPTRYCQSEPTAAPVGQ